MPNFWRAPTDNDFGNYMGDWAAVWQQADRNRELSLVELKSENEDKIAIRAIYSFRDDTGNEVATWKTVYTIDATGGVDVDNHFERRHDLPVVPRIGMNVELIGGLDRPSQGSVEVGGERIDKLSNRKLAAWRARHVGLVFQFYNLVPTLTAKENVALIAELASADGLQRTEEVLERVGLADRMDHFPGQLSGGEQQRVSIARGLVKDPPLMLCDEPTGSLDVESGISILNLLRDVTRDSERSVLIVTHNSVTAKMADRVIRLRDGQIVDQEVNPSPAEPEQLDW